VSSVISEVLWKRKMAVSNVNMQTLAEQIHQISAQLLTSEMKQMELENQIKNMSSEHQLDFNNGDRTGRAAVTSNSDVEPTITSGDQIQLDSYKAIPEFSGNIHEYRPWRYQVYHRMKIIEKFMEHPKYEAALAIIRAKITGPASHVLVNNKSSYNITAIITILDTAYTDQRPLYAIEAEMISIKQNDKNLGQYFNAILFSLNDTISKIVMLYPTDTEQRSLINETQKKAVRTFIVGLKSRTTRQILYGRQPKTLTEAYSIAQTVLYDNESMQLDQNKSIFQQRTHQQHSTNHNKQQKQWTNNNPWNQQRNHNFNNHNFNQQRNNNFYQQRNYSEPMEVDGSGQVKSNWRQPTPQSYGQKRELGSRRSELPQKMQRINRLMDAVQQIPSDLISTSSNDSTRTNVSSAFLGE
jgi:hypothetical protein